jgi:transcriptional regulator with XRE-family HTH domain
MYKIHKIMLTRGTSSKYRKKHHMTYNEFCRQLGKAGLSIIEFAKLIKMNHRSVSNYATANKVPDHLAIIAALMGEMADSGLDFREVLGGIRVEFKRPRGGAAKGQFGGANRVTAGKKKRT